jgi:hypothetical protein
LEPELQNDLAETMNKLSVVAVVEEYGHAAVTASHDMADEARSLKTASAWHESQIFTSHAIGCQSVSGGIDLGFG